jgi:hypothetical protein
VAEWDERSVRLKDERRDGVCEWAGRSVNGKRSGEKRRRIFRQEVAIEEIEMDDDSIARFGLEPCGFDKGDSKLVVIRRRVRKRFSRPPHDFEGVDLKELSALLAGKMCDPLEFVTVELREREDETECDPGLAEKGEPGLHRFKGAR